MSLQGKLVEVNMLKDQEIESMFGLMDRYYEGMTRNAFLRDLEEKEYSILLQDNTGVIRGFSSQTILRVTAAGRQIHGVFSGDTIIQKEYWGSLALFQVFARHFLRIGQQYADFYWFLISKGYKTYRILPLFFNQFYPRPDVSTPAADLAIMDAFGHSRYPGEYQSSTGVIVYRSEKDRLREGVADITPKQLKDEHTAFFQRMNPDHGKGNDLVCLARLEESNLNRKAHRLLLEKP